MKKSETCFSKNGNPRSEFETGMQGGTYVL